MSEDLVQAAKAASELEPAVEAFAEATGLLDPIREVAAWATDLIRYRRLPHQAKLLVDAAEKIKASGLPASAVEDKFLKAVIEEGPFEDDPSMQERWSNLLANAATSKEGRLKIAFPKILSELEPEEAALLDNLAQQTSDKSFRTKKFSASEPGSGEQLPELDNLNRLGLIHYVRYMPATWDSISDENATISGFRFTRLGWEFVQACRNPHETDTPISI